jgi:hypothetical protein
LVKKLDYIKALFFLIAKIMAIMKTKAFTCAHDIPEFLDDEN